jgi:hypothetical protein
VPKKQDKSGEEYYQVEEGEWVDIVRRGFVMVCCDCRLTHTMNLKIKDRKTHLQCFRDDKETKRLRRLEGIKIAKRNPR